MTRSMPTNGWKMPPNTDYVGRPTKWGTPYDMCEHMNWQQAVEAYRLVAHRLPVENCAARILAVVARSISPVMPMFCWS